MDDLNNSHLYALVVGEASGDTLGAGLMRAILRIDPKAKFIGIGGPKMISCGMISSFNMSELSVMGISEVISHLFPILKIRHNLIKILIDAKPCVFIGIDSPDFNLKVEKELKKASIPTIHYVSPSVWAWRAGRIKTIKESCDEVLALLPFEKEVYDRENMPCTYVGHTLANQIPFGVSAQRAKDLLSFSQTCVDEEFENKKVMTILPGSRKGIVSRMMPIYAKACRLIKEKHNDIVFICGTLNYDLAVLIKDIWLEYAPDISLTIYTGQTRDVIAAADSVLLTCGTVAFETMLLNRPMCVAYRVNPLTALVVKKMLTVDSFSLPNLLAKRKIVSEYIQDECTPENLANEMLKLLKSDNLLLKKEFESIHRQIKINSDDIAAKAVFACIERVNKELKEKALIEKTNEASKKATKSAKNVAKKEASKDVNLSFNKKEPKFIADIDVENHTKSNNMLGRQDPKL